MRKGKERDYPGYQVGTSFLLVIFVVMCLVLLGVLSLSGALRDRSYGDRVAEKTTLYYAAVSEAQHRLGEIDRVLAAVGSQGKSAEVYQSDAARAVSEIEGVSCRQDGGRTMVSYEIPITESQNLCVELEVPDPGTGEGNYKIVKWQEASLSVWEEEEPLPVLLFE